MLSVSCAGYVVGWLCRLCVGVKLKIKLNPAQLELELGLSLVISGFEIYYSHQCSLFLGFLLMGCWELSQCGEGEILVIAKCKHFPDELLRCQANIMTSINIAYGLHNIAYGVRIIAYLGKNKNSLLACYNWLSKLASIPACFHYHQLYVHCT